MIARIAVGAGADARGRPQRATAPAASAGNGADARRPGVPDGTRVSPVAARAAAARGRRPRRPCRAAAARVGSPSPTCSAAASAARRAATARHRHRPPRRVPADAGGAAALARYMEAVALDPHGDELPHAHGDRSSTAAAASSRRAPRKVSFTHLIAYAIARAAEEMPVMTNHFEEIEGKPTPGRRRPGQPRAGGRRREEGRLAHADGAGDPRRRHARLRRLPRRLRRARREGAHEHADRGRPRRREHHPDQPRRHRHDRLGAAPDARPGHDHRHRLDRLPVGPRRDRRDDRRGEGHDDDLDLRPPRSSRAPSRGASWR